VTRFAAVAGAVQLLQLGVVVVVADRSCRVERRALAHPEPVTQPVHPLTVVRTFDRNQLIPYRMATKNWHIFVRLITVKC